MVDYVSDFSQGLNVFAGLDRSKFTRRAAWLGFVAIVLIVLGVTFPKYAQAFFLRMGLQRANYPTATQIETVWVNGAEHAVSDLHSLQLRSAYGQPVRFQVRVSGDAPTTGKILLASATANRELELKSGNPAATVSADSGPTLPCCTANCHSCLTICNSRLRLAMRKTDPAQLVVIPLPVVELQLGVNTPEYAKGVAAETPIEPGMRQIAVVEGSAVDVRIDCTNKTLKSVTLGVTAKEGERTELPLQAIDSAGKNWVYQPAANSSLGNITDAVKFDLQVVDQDGLDCLPRSKARPREAGSASLGLDLCRCSTTIAAGNPEIDLRATDDYGLAQLRLLVSIERAPTDVATSNPSGADSTNSLSGNFGERPLFP